MRYHLYTLSEKILTIRVPAKAPKYIVPIAIFVLYFAISPLVVSHLAVKIGELTRLVLLGLFILNIFHKKQKIPSLGLTPIFLMFMFFSDLAQGNIAVGINPKPMVGYALHVLVNTSIGLIILLQLYMKSWDRFIEILKVLVLAVTVTCSLIGFYQIVSGEKLADFSMVTEGGQYLEETERLTSLTGGAAVMLLACLGLLSAPFFLKDKRKLIYLLICLNGLALILTFSRGAYIAFIAMVTVGIFLILRTGIGKISKKIQNAMIVLLIGALAVFMFFSLGMPYLVETGEIQRFENPANIIARIKWWRLSLDIIDNYVFTGIGLRSDLSAEFWKYAFVYKTPHNFIIAWIMRMGLISAMIIFFMVLRQVFHLFNHLRRPLSPSIYWVGFSLTISYIGVLVASLGGSDSLHYVLLMAALSNAYLKLTPTVGRAPIAKSFR
jgi:O-antigen ligase